MLFQDWDDDVFQRVDDMGCSDDECTDHLVDGLQPTDFPTNDFIMQGAAAVASCPPPVILTPCPPASVYPSSPAIKEALAVAASKLKDHKIQALLQPPVDSSEFTSEPSLHLEYDGAGRAIGAVVTMSTCPDTRAAQAAATNVKAGEAMPFIRLPLEDRPSITTTAQLHLLSDEQEFAFRLIMDTMDKHLRKEQDILSHS